MSSNPKNNNEANEEIFFLLNEGRQLYFFERIQWMPIVFIRMKITHNDLPNRARHIEAITQVISPSFNVLPIIVHMKKKNVRS